jgi:hypothetical protein
MVHEPVDVLRVGEEHLAEGGPILNAEPEQVSELGVHVESLNSVPGRLRFLNLEQFLLLVQTATLHLREFLHKMEQSFGKERVHAGHSLQEVR